jgi:hypothetical protein
LFGWSSSKKLPENTKESVNLYASFLQKIGNEVRKKNGTYLKKVGLARSESILSLKNTTTRTA